MSTKVDRAVNQSLLDVVNDVRRVSSAAAPHKSGKLEKNISTVKRDGSTITGTVEFKAVNRRFDYAEWTHNADYNLGEGSRKKPGGKSVFGGSVPVGKGYLARTIEGGNDGYLDHIKQGYYKGLM